MLGRWWLTTVVSLGLVLLIGGIGLAAGSFADSETSLANAFQAWTSTAWVQTTRTDFEAGVLNQTDTRSSLGDVGLARDDRIFAFQGGSVNFWRYGVPANSWASMAAVQNPVGAGGALAYDGARYIYAFRGGGNRTFWRYDTINNAWVALANTPAGGPVGAGGALAYDGARYVYAFRGGGNRTFWRYDIINNAWVALANTPAGGTVGAGGALAYDGSRYIYAFRGNTSTTFWRYDITNNSWATRTAAPSTVAAGGSLAYDGTHYIYAFRGNGQAAFWRYDTVLNSWDSTSLQAAPAAVAGGGALAYASSSYIYALRGNGTAAFWRYDILGNSWTSMANALGNVADGGALAFVAASTYVNSATMASQVRDTGTAGARCDGLFWDETLQLNTDITFEVRASNTLFAPGDALPAWTPVGGTSPITSGLPSGRYMQWRATLTTSNTSVTPVLHEVRLYHY